MPEIEDISVTYQLVDRKPVSAYIDMPVDKAISALDILGYNAISLEQAASVRMKCGKDSFASNRHR
ncbi:hypothetical protein J4231_02135 [Candidatus Woesearchaeota archaeon]|nr:hypothetical protein [Candidatus Woesearchaeota archaeon]